MIKSILIDIDNTLYDYDIANEYAINSVILFWNNRYGISNELFIEKFCTARNIIHKQLINTASSHNRLLYYQKTLELLDIKNILLAKDLYNIYWDSFLSSMTIYDGVLDFLKYYADKQICLITDLTAYIQYRKIEKLGINQYISYIVTSEEAGIEKPNSKIFELCLEKLKLSPQNVCMIGDSFEKDIIGAKELDIKTFQKIKKEYNCYDGNVFVNFRELIGII